MAELYLVSTPIGNLADVTLRALDTLRRVDLVLAEDTRRTRILLDHHGIGTPLSSLHEHNEARRVESVLERLADGGTVALVSDAGTPLVSDPGSRLVRSVVEAGHPVVPIPGPSAVLAALVASGLPGERFTFLGFAPRKGAERQRTLERVSASEETCVLFEAPPRLVRLLTDLAEACGEDREACVAREVTKMHEEFRRGVLRELADHYQAHPPRGEVTLVVAPSAPRGVEDPDIEASARALLAEGLRPSQAAQALSQRLGISRNHAYRVVQSLAGRDP
ncbi:MAG: 16S rRNA (cytidine(1402)-2'-O)-methyltransferase [Gemmatimonadota bacterium]